MRAAAGAAAVGAGAGEVQVIVPREDPLVVLRNPDMGWVLYENFPVDHRLTAPGEPASADWSAVEAVAVMFSWADVERAPDVFDWARVDAAMDYWRQRGKALHLRLSTEPLFGWSRLRPPGGLGIPDWVLAQVPEAQKRCRHDGANFGWHVDARQAFYQERLRRFLAAVHAHCSGPRTPQLIDLRGFGRWGEWHSGFPYPTVPERRAALAAVLEIWSAAFPGRQLALSYSFDPDGPPAYHAGPTQRFDPAATEHYDDYVRYSAFDLALARPNITWRRDGAGGAVTSNERRLCEHAYRDWRRAPMMSEFVGGYAAAAKAGAAHLRWIIDDALSLHPNYIGLLGYAGREAEAFLREQPECVAHGARGLGYRLVPVRAELPVRVRAGEAVAFTIDWINRGAGRALRDYVLQVRCVAGAGQVLAEATMGAVPTRAWLQGELHRTRGTVVWAAPPAAGTVCWQIALTDPATGRAIALPLAGVRAEPYYELGRVELRP